jgi:hypothetical protein
MRTKLNVRNGLRDGFQVNCHNCNRLLTLSKETKDAFIRRAPKTARGIRAEQQNRLLAATYGDANTTPKRETP